MKKIKIKTKQSSVIHQTFLPTSLFFYLCIYRNFLPIWVSFYLKIKIYQAFLPACLSSFLERHIYIPNPPACLLVSFLILIHLHNKQPINKRQVVSTTAIIKNFMKKKSPSNSNLFAYLLTFQSNQHITLIAYMVVILLGYYNLTGTTFYA